VIHGTDNTRDSISGRDKPGNCRSTVLENGVTRKGGPVLFPIPPCCSSESYLAEGTFPDQKGHRCVRKTDATSPSEKSLPTLLEYRGTTPQNTQRRFDIDTLAVKETILHKLSGIGRDDLTKSLAKCHTEETVAACGNCGRFKAFWNRCDQSWCPICQPRVSRRRRDSVDWFRTCIRAPKHLILTIRNTATITKGQVDRFKQNLARLRRRSVAKTWLGGLWSLETTNEGRGWHLHVHLLIDTAWIDIRAVSRIWGTLNGQDYAIVKVKEVRGDSYLREIVKYTVKGSQLAGWKPQEIAAYIDAFAGGRTFGVFGTLYKQRADWKRDVEALREEKSACECGANRWKYYTPDEWQWHLLEREGRCEPPGATPPVTTALEVQDELNVPDARRRCRN
jgi:hypothetical protein